MTAEGSNVAIQTWSCRALGDIARDAMSPTKEYTGNAFNAKVSRAATSLRRCRVAKAWRGQIKSAILRSLARVAALVGGPGRRLLFK